MAGDWLSIAVSPALGPGPKHRVGPNHRVGSKGRKASAPNQTASHVEQVVMDNESEGVYVRAVMENRPTLANACHKQAQAGPKRGRS